LSADSQLKVLQPLTETVDPAAAGRLRLAADQVNMASFVRLHGGRPFSHTVVYLPTGVGTHLRDAPELSTAGTLSEVTVIGLLDQVLAEPIQVAEQSISVAGAPTTVAGALEIPPEFPVLRIDRSYYDRAERPVEIAISHFHPDRYTYRVRLRRAVG
jgi:DNA-binding GntR family transcriptional regulator